MAADIARMAEVLVSPPSRELTHLDDLRCLLNPVQSMDLATILELTPGARRPEVALAFTGLNEADWARASGLLLATVNRWLLRQCRLPWGGALRLAKVLGVPAEVLFKDWP